MNSKPINSSSSRPKENVQIPGFKTLCQLMPSDPDRLKRVALLKEQIRQIVRERSKK